MKNILKVGILGLALSLVLGVSVAFAATDITHLTLNGLSNTSVEEGDSVSAKVTFDLTTDDDAESLSSEVLDSGLPKTCVNISDRINSGTFTTSFNLGTEGATPGSDYDVRIIVYGTDDEGANQTCEGAGDDSVTFTNRLTIEENDGDQPPSSTPSSGVPSWFCNFFPNHCTPATPPATPPAANPATCASIDYNLSMGMRNGEVAELQAALISSGQSIPAGATSYFGQQTFAAVKAYQSSKGIPSTGFVGPLTRGALGAGCSG